MTEIFKYRVWNDYSQSIIEKGQLYFAAPASFNDPFEFRPYVDNYSSENDLHTFIEHGLEEFLDLIAGGQVPGDEAAKVKELVANLPPEVVKQLVANETPKIAANESFRKEVLDRTAHFQDEVLNDFGVCCFSSSYSNILMWSHYANNHSGFCVGFDINKDPTLATCRPVSYTHFLPQIPGFRLDDDALQERIIEDLVFTKADIWRYEDEWRCVVDARSGDRTRNCELISITKIVLGAKMPQEGREHIWKLAHRFIPHAKLIQLSCHDTEYELIESVC